MTQFVRGLYGGFRDWHDVCNGYNVPALVGACKVADHPRIGRSQEQEQLVKTPKIIHCPKISGL